MKQWEKKEKRDAKDYGGHRTKASGSQWNDPGDVKHPRYLFDSKHTEKASFTVTKAIWDKLSEEAAFAQQRIPVLSVQMKGIELVVMSREEFLLLIQEKKIKLD